MSEPSAQIAVHVKPRANQDRIMGWKPDGTLQIRIAAPPVDGAANKRVIAFLARICGVAKQQVSIVSGQTSPIKRIRIEGRSAKDIRRLIRPYHQTDGEG